MSDWREAAAQAAASGRYEDALEIFATRPELCASDLALKGRCIQLSSAGRGREIEDAVGAFREALAVDPDYVPALIELGCSSSYESPCRVDRKKEDEDSSRTTAGQ